MSPLRDALAEYLQVRRRLGYEMPQDGRLLEVFVAFLEQAGAERITTELALTWARLPTHAHPSRWRQRLTVVRGFARYVATLDPASEIPSSDLLPGTRPRLTPHIYTNAEIVALMAAARKLRPRLRAARHETLIGLLAHAMESSPCKVVLPVEANMVLLELPSNFVPGFRERYRVYALNEGSPIMRLMTSWSITRRKVEGLIAFLRHLEALDGSVPGSV